MAKLFKDNIIKEKLESFEVPDIEEKLEVLKSWKQMQENKTLEKSTEIELQGPFGEKFFSKILGYENIGEGEYSMKFEPKVPVGGQKADIGLGFFSPEKEIMKVVVELKDARTSLDKPQQRAGNLTPVQQAFKYKPYFKECDFIIVSNFVEIRLYIDSYYDYEVWTLDDLVDSKDNYYKFRKFYYLLSKQNFIAKKGDSNTKSLLSVIRVQEKEITKEFYKEYKELRLELLRDMRDKNATDGKISRERLNLVLEKAQKIIDRIVFIHFCEDLGLLPEHKLKETVDYADNLVGVPIWEILKGFFEAVNSGSDKLGIPDGYNGGLFHKDEELESLKVGDDICKKFVELGAYDFKDDLSVNILGHIFEQSISDIEEIKDKINKNPPASGYPLDKGDFKVSKRKKDGVFYTPEYIVDYIVKNSVGKKIEEWEDELKEKHGLKEDITDKNYEKRARVVYNELQEKVQNIKVLDPACGSGAFLVKVFDFLLDKNKEISKRLEDLGESLGLMGTETYFKTILQNNIYGVDLNEESVEITKLSLWLKTAQKGKKLANLDSNIKCGNSLIDDKEIAGDKAFVWETEFKEIFDNGGFDVIVGNPPYVPAEGIDKKSKEYFENKFDSAEGRLNLYIIFYELGLRILNNNGFLGYITPYTLLKNKYYFHLRKFILDNSKISQIIDFQNFKIFDDAVVDSIVLILEKNKNNEYMFDFISDVKSFQEGKYNFEKINIDSIISKDDLSFIVSDNNILTDEFLKNTMKLGEVINFKQGIITGGNSKFITSQELDNTKKIITGSNFNRYSLNYSGDYIIYDKDNLHRPRTEEIFEQNEKILLRQTGSFPITTIDTNGYYTLDTVHNGLLINNDFSLQYISLLLNSSLLKYIYISNINEGGKVFAQVKIIYINELPIKNIPLSEQKPFIEKADFMLLKNKELGEKVNKFLKRLNSSFEIEKLSKKLEAFYDLEFSEFVKELKKKKVELSLVQQDEWEEYFDSYKKVILELKSEIDSCDREIDDMVFDLYGLDYGERGVVLGGNG